ncbi:MAG: hypothetical protein FJ137_11160 [Deltaproteobacteria bacterium]|nr:hypothetical protein [Deltaproteobacteria bacterium]
MRSVALWMVVVLGVPVGAARAEAPVLVYVNEFTVQDPKLASDAGALTSALCAALARDKRVDVLCAPDVRQLLSFAAASSMMGSTSPATENLERRAAATRFVVSGRVVVDKTGSTLSMSIGPRDDGSDLSSMFASSALAKRDEPVEGKTLGLLARVPAVARSLVDAALAPPVGEDSAATTAPPAPLAPTSTPTARSSPSAPAAATKAP